jgi:hypothetical protein
MKATEVYSIVKADLGPWFKAAGFRIAKNQVLGFSRPLSSGRLVAWFQTDRFGWDAYQGGAFRLLTATFPEDTAMRDYEEAFQYFLTDEELDQARLVQDEVIASLPVPSESYFTVVAGQFRREQAEQIVATLRQNFQPVALPYRWNVDFFLRYHRGEHVRRWCNFLLPLLPRIVQRTEQRWRRERS